MSHPKATDPMRDHYSAAAIRYRHQRERKQIRCFFGAVLLLFIVTAGHSLVI